MARGQFVRPTERRALQCSAALAILAITCCSAWSKENGPKKLEQKQQEYVQKTKQDNSPEKQAQNLRNLALKKESQGDIASTAALEESAFKIDEKYRGQHYYNKEGDLYRLRELFLKLGNYDVAEHYCRRLLALSEEIYGINSPNAADALDSLAGILKREGRTAEASATQAKAEAIENANLNGDITGKKLPIFKQNNSISKDTILHPVLNSRAGRGLDGKQLDCHLFKELSALTQVANINHRSVWNTYFGRAEEEAALQFCRTAKGMTKAQVEACTGAPRFRGGKVDCWNFCKPGEDTWLYAFGEKCVPVSLVFRQDRCIEAKRHSDDLDRDYQIWRANEFISFAKGKTAAEIIAYAGKPAQSQLNGTIYPVDSKKNHKLDYVLGSHTLVGLYMRKGICIGAHKYIIAR